MTDGHNAGAGAAHPTPSAARLQVQARGRGETGARSAVRFSLRSQRGLLRILRVRHGRDAARARAFLRALPRGFKAAISTMCRDFMWCGPRTLTRGWKRGSRGAGWTTFDPTPRSSSAPRPGILSRLTMYLDAADHAWQEWVVSYDLSHQVAIAARFEAALRGWNRTARRPDRDWSRRVASEAKTWGVAILGVFLLVDVGGAVWAGDLARMAHEGAVAANIRSGDRSTDAGVLYERMLEMLAKRGFRSRAWFTPNEFARHLPAEESRTVMEFTEVYNSIRFGGELSATSRLAGMLQEFEREARRRRMASA